MECSHCQGSGYGDDGDCSACSGTGRVDWWKSAEYKQTGRVPDTSPKKTDKGFAELGLLFGIPFGLYIYMITADSTVSLVSGCVGAVFAGAFLKWVTRYMIPLLAVGYVIYLLFF